MKSEANILPVSVIVLADQPTALLETSLKSAIWAAERILVVTSSSDKWVSVADRHDAVLVQHPGMISDFAKTRNWAITYASQDWVLFLDSDEVLLPNTRQAVARAVKSGADGFLITRTDVYRGHTLKWGEVGSAKILRLAKRERFKFERPVHEVGQTPGRVKLSQIKVDHFSHENVGEFIESVKTYAQLEANYRISQGQGFSVLRLIFYPFSKWIVNYIFRLGFLDGYAGFVYATLMSFHSIMVSIFLYENALDK